MTRYYSGLRSLEFNSTEYTKHLAAEKQNPHMLHTAPVLITQCCKRRLKKAKKKIVP